MMDYRLALMAGIDIPIPECELVIHQPTIKEIAFLGEQDFFIGIQCLCLNKRMFSQDERVLEQVTNFQIFMMVMNDVAAQDKKAKVIAVLQVLFPGHQIFFTPRSLIIKKDEESKMIDDKNFDFLQSIISKICCLSASDHSDFNPGNKAAQIIADKLMRARQRVAAQKAAEGEDVSAFAQHLSVLTVGLGSMSLEQCLNLTIYQIQDLMERYSLYINWDIDIRSRMAGASGDKPIDNWMKNIH